MVSWIFIFYGLLEVCSFTQCEDTNKAEKGYCEEKQK